MIERYAAVMPSKTEPSIETVRPSDSVAPVTEVASVGTGGGKIAFHWASVTVMSARAKMVEALGLVRVFQAMTSYCFARSSEAVGAVRACEKAPSTIATC